MDDIKRRRIAGQVKRFCGRFAQGPGAALGQVIPPQSLTQWIKEEAGNRRERVYGPLQTLMLFIEQVLGADQSCQDAVARGVSQRVALGQSPCSLNDGPYCKARARLALNLVERLGHEVGERLSTTQPDAWRWRGREVKLIDGTTVSMPTRQRTRSSSPRVKTRKPAWAFRWRAWWRSFPCPVARCWNGPPDLARANEPRRRRSSGNWSRTFDRAISPSPTAISPAISCWPG